MGWFDELLTDIARQSAPGIHKAIFDYGEKQRQLDAFRQGIPAEVERQQALMPGEIEKLRTAGDIQMRNYIAREAAKNRGQGGLDILGLLRSTVEVPQSPDVMPIPARAPGYGAGEEATSGVVPPTQTMRGTDALMRLWNLNPAEHEAVPHIGTTGVTLSFPRRPGTAGGRDPLGEYSRERMAAEKEADDLGLTGQSKASHIETRMAKYRQAQSTATTLGGYSGPGQAARVETAGKAGEEGAAGRIRGELRPVATPGQGPPVPGVQAVEAARVPGQALPASERGRFAELYNLQNMIERIRALTNNFQSGWFGPVRGGIVAPFSERFTGNISDEEVQARRLMMDASDMLLRARSGAQINEQEYARLKKLLPTPDLPENVAKARMDDFERTLRVLVSERERLQRTPSGELGASTPRTTQPPLPRPNPGEKVKYDTQGRSWVNRNGVVMEVQR